MAFSGLPTWQQGLIIAAIVVVVIGLIFLILWLAGVFDSSTSETPVVTIINPANPVVTSTPAATSARVVHEGSQTVIPQGSSTKMTVTFKSAFEDIPNVEVCEVDDMATVDESKIKATKSSFEASVDFPDYPVQKPRGRSIGTDQRVLAADACRSHPIIVVAEPDGQTISARESSDGHSGIQEWKSTTIATSLKDVESASLSSRGMVDVVALATKSGIVDARWRMNSVDWEELELKDSIADVSKVVAHITSTGRVLIVTVSKSGEAHVYSNDGASKVLSKATAIPRGTGIVDVSVMDLDKASHVAFTTLETDGSISFHVSKCDGIGSKFATSQIVNAGAAVSVSCAKVQGKPIAAYADSGNDVHISSSVDELGSAWRPVENAVANEKGAIRDLTVLDLYNSAAIAYGVAEKNILIRMQSADVVAQDLVERIELPIVSEGASSPTLFRPGKGGAFVVSSDSRYDVIPDRFVVQWSSVH